MFPTKDASKTPAVSATPKVAGAGLSVKEAAEYLGVSEMRIRTLLREAKIPGAAKVTKEDSEVEKWVIPPSGLDEYKSKKGTFGASGARAGGKAHIVRVSGKEQFDILAAFCAKQTPPIVIEPRYHYDHEKQKAYRVKRQATLKEAKAKAKAEGKKA